MIPHDVDGTRACNELFICIHLTMYAYDISLGAPLLVLLLCPVAILVTSI